MFRKIALALGLLFPLVTEAEAPARFDFGVSFPVACEVNDSYCRRILARQINQCENPSGERARGSDCFQQVLNNHPQLEFQASPEYRTLMVGLQRRILTASREAGISPIYLFGIFYMLDQDKFHQTIRRIVESSSFSAENGELLDFSRSGLESIEENDLNFAATLEEAPEAIQALIASKPAGIERMLARWAQGLAVAKLKITQGPNPELAREPLAMLSVARIASLESSSGRVANVPFRFTFTAWLVAKFWQDIVQMSQSFAPDKRLSVQALTPRNLLYPDLASAALLLGNQRLGHRLSARIPVYAHPDRCSSAQASASGPAQELQLLRDRRRLVRGQAGPGVVDFIQTTWSCGEQWALLRGSQPNELGWGRLSDILANLQATVVNDRCERQEFQNDCRDQIQEIVGEHEIIGFNSNDRSLEIRLVGFPESPRVDFSRFSPDCIDETLRRQMQARAAERRTEVENRSSEEASAESPWQQARLNRFDLSRGFSLHDHNGRAVSFAIMPPDLRDWIRAKANELRAEIRRLAGGADLAGPGNSLSFILDWYYELERNCTSVCLGADRQAFELFFNLASPRNLQNRDHIFRLERDFNLRRQRYITGDLQESLLNTYPLDNQRQQNLEHHSADEQFSHIEAACAEIPQFLPNNAPRIELIRQTYRQLRNHRLGGHFVLPIEVYVEITDLCRAMVNAIKRGQNASAELALEPRRRGLELPLTISSIGRSDSGPGLGLFQIAVNIRDMQYLGLNMQDAELVSSRLLDGINQIYLREIEAADRWLAERPLARANAASFIEDRAGACLYNPVASKNRIDSILALDCVAGVIVPQEDFLNKQYLDPRVRGAHWQTSHRDRVKILLKGQCL